MEDIINYNILRLIFPSDSQGRVMLNPASPCSDVKGKLSPRITLCLIIFSALKVKYLEYIKSLTTETKDIKSVCYQLANNDPELLEEMADLYQFEVDVPTKRMKMETSEPETVETIRSAVQKYRMSSSNGGTVLKSIVDR